MNIVWMRVVRNSLLTVLCCSASKRRLSEFAVLALGHNLAYSTAAHSPGRIEAAAWAQNVLRRVFAPVPNHALGRLACKGLAAALSSLVDARWSALQHFASQRTAAKMSWACEHGLDEGGKEFAVDLAVLLSEQEKTI